MASLIGKRKHLSMSPLSPSLLGSKSKMTQEKTFNDPVHKAIKMSGLCLRVIDTREFQRLGYLKQLGCCDKVFRGATHTRFIHSLGVAHLAEKLIYILKDNQPELGITERDLISVKMAGLCHDLGHGPFSHVFDGVFMKAMHPKGIVIEGKDGLYPWKHEMASIDMLEHLLEVNHIDITDYGLDDIDLVFIKEMIEGVDVDKRVGRDKKKAFLYDIVNNVISGLDVDKLDYFMRDMMMTNVNYRSDFSRSIFLYVYCYYTSTLSLSLLL